MRALPGVAQNSQERSSQPASGAAEAIPESVIARPIIGEARRFDGAVAPTGWMLMHGDVVKIADYALLYKVLGASAGGDGKTTFKIPKPPAGWIIAVAGTFPSSPTVFNRLGRHTDAETSLGAGARPAQRMPSLKQLRATEARNAALAADVRAAQNAVRVGPASSVPVTAEFTARLASTRRDARDAALAAVNPQNRALVLSLVEAILGRQISVFDATQRMSAALDGDEARRVLDVYDARQRVMNGPVSPHGDLRLEGGRYLVAVAFSDEQLQQLRTMQIDG